MSNTPEHDSNANEPSRELNSQVREPMLLILAKHERSIKSTASFLTRRGVPARFITSLNDAIDAFSANSANMLLLSVNFPHPKIEMIPALINQSFNIEVIAFAEDSDRKSAQKLQNVKTRHVIQGPVSGPTVLMRIRQIEKELAGDTSQQASDSNARGASRASDSDQSINVRGGSLSGVAKQEALASLMSAASERLAGEDASSGRASLSFGGAGGESEFGALAASGQTYVQKGSRTASHLVTPNEALRAAVNRGLEDAHGVKPKLIVPLPPEMRRQGRSAQTRATYRRPQLAAEFHDGIETKKRKRAESDEEDLFQRCLAEAVETVVGEADETRSRLSIFRKAMLVAVRSPKMKAAFLIGVGKSKHKPIDLMERVQVAFFSLMRANGIDLETAEQFSIELDQTELARRAFSSSEHVLIAEDGGTELGVAVVSVVDPLPEILPYERDMLRVPLRDIPEEEPVPFNIFLHLKRNGRFLRYVRLGSMISKKQVSRLERFKVTHVLVKQDEQEAYSRHFAAHSIQPTKRRKPAA